MPRIGPNKPEIIVYRGIKFRRYPTAREHSSRFYFVPGHADRKKGIKRLHQQKWIDVNGPIPKGHEIHHKDGNPLNNEIGNLECLSEAEHDAIHVAAFTPEEIEQRRIKFAKVRKKAANWHRSQPGRAWHRKLGKESWKGRSAREYVCELCGKSYETISAHRRNRFCSPNCRSTFRYRSGKDNATARCKFCGKSFEFNRYVPRECCSRKCAQQLRRLKPRRPMTEAKAEVF